MPMPQTEWARGKCGYKLLQYFAAGIPRWQALLGLPIGCSTGAEGLLPPQRRSGFVASASSEGTQSLHRDGRKRPGDCRARLLP